MMLCCLGVDYCLVAGFDCLPRLGTLVLRFGSYDACCLPFGLRIVMMDCIGWLWVAWQ